LLSCYHLIEEEDVFDTAIVLAQGIVPRKKQLGEYDLYKSDEWKMWNEINQRTGGIR
jgi:hypothetical protein